MKRISRICYLILAVMLCGWQSLYAQPSTPAPTPTRPQSEVKSLFSDVYEQLQNSKLSMRIGQERQLKR